MKLDSVANTAIELAEAEGANYAKDAIPNLHNESLTQNKRGAELGWLKGKYKCMQFVGDVLHESGFEVPTNTMNKANGGGEHYVIAESLPTYRKYFERVSKLEEVQAGDVMVVDYLGKKGEGGGHAEIVTNAEYNGGKSNFSALSTVGARQEGTKDTDWTALLENAEFDSKRGVFVIENFKTDKFEGPVEISIIRPIKQREGVEVKKSEAVVEGRRLAPPSLEPLAPIAQQDSSANNIITLGKGWDWLEHRDKVGPELAKLLIEAGPESFPNRQNTLALQEDGTLRYLSFAPGDNIDSRVLRLLPDTERQELEQIGSDLKGFGYNQGTLNSVSTTGLSLPLSDQAKEKLVFLGAPNLDPGFKFSEIPNVRTFTDKKWDYVLPPRMAVDGTNVSDKDSYVYSNGGFVPSWTDQVKNRVVDILAANREAKIVKGEESGIFFAQDNVIRAQTAEGNPLDVVQITGGNAPQAAEDSARMLNESFPTSEFLDLVVDLKRKQNELLKDEERPEVHRAAENFPVFAQLFRERPEYTITASDKAGEWDNLELWVAVSRSGIEVLTMTYQPSSDKFRMMDSKESGINFIDDNEDEQFISRDRVEEYLERIDDHYKDQN